jgi:hypothetical protein
MTKIINLLSLQCVLHVQYVILSTGVDITLNHRHKHRHEDIRQQQVTTDSGPDTQHDRKRPNCYCAMVKNTVRIQNIVAQETLTSLSVSCKKKISDKVIPAGTAGHQ